MSFITEGEKFFKEYKANIKAEIMKEVNQEIDELKQRINSLEKENLKKKNENRVKF